MSAKWDFKFPSGPPAGYNPEDPYADKVALLEMREHHVREKYVQIAKAKILREKLRDCYMTEGVNHIAKCKNIAEAYCSTIAGAGIARANSGPDWSNKHQ